MNSDSANNINLYERFKGFSRLRLAYTKKAISI